MHMHVHTHMRMHTCTRTRAHTHTHTWPYTTSNGRIYQQNSSLFKAFMILLIVILMGMTFMGTSISLRFYYKHIIDYQTITLGSKRVYPDTSAVLLNNITVSNFTPFDSFTFSTQSGGLIDIRIIDCKLHVYKESISRWDAIGSGRTFFFGKPLAIGSSITVQVKTESRVYEHCSTKLVVFEGWEDADKYTKTGEKKQPYEEFCVTKQSRYLFTPQKKCHISLLCWKHQKKFGTR